MTEKDLDILQKDIYWWLLKKMNGIPPILQKLIIEGIYSRFQTNAEHYDWELKIQEEAEKNKSGESTTEAEMRLPDYMQQEKNCAVDSPECIKNSRGELQETSEGVVYS